MLGLALLLAGWLLRTTTGERGLATVHAAELVPSETVWRRRPAPALTPLGADADYRVFVPDVGEFTSIDAAEQRALDRRWASAGSPTLGAPGQRSDESAG
jgi:hypothetical protein